MPVPVMQGALKYLYLQYSLDLVQVCPIPCKNWPRRVLADKCRLPAKLVRNTCRLRLQLRRYLGDGGGGVGKYGPNGFGSVDLKVTCFSDAGETR